MVSMDFGYLTAAGDARNHGPLALVQFPGKVFGPAIYN